MFNGMTEESGGGNNLKGKQYVYPFVDYETPSGQYGPIHRFGMDDHGDHYYQEFGRNHSGVYKSPEDRLRDAANEYDYAVDYLWNDIYDSLDRRLGQHQFRREWNKNNSFDDKPAEDKMLSFGSKDLGKKLTDSLKQLPQVTKLANYNKFNTWGVKGALDNMIIDIDYNLRRKLDDMALEAQEKEQNEKEPADAVEGFLDENNRMARTDPHSPNDAFKQLPRLYLGLHKQFLQRMNQPTPTFIKKAGPWKDDDGNYTAAKSFQSAMSRPNVGGSFKDALLAMDGNKKQEWLNNNYGGRGLGYMGQNAYPSLPMAERRKLVQQNARPALLRQLARMNRPKTKPFGAGLYQFGKMPWQS